MPPSVYLPVFGSGLGHASRMVLIGRKLQKEGISLVYSSSFDAVEYIRRAGFSCFEVPGIDVPWTSYGAFSGLPKMFRKVPSMAKTFLRQLRAELRNIKRLGSKLVISDTRLSAVVASFLCKVPSLTVTNQLRILPPPEHDSLITSFVAMLSVDRLTQLWVLSDLILVPDLPPPYTIAERNLWGIRSAKRKMKYVGFTTIDHKVQPDKVDKLRKFLGIEKGKPLVFAQISGPLVTKLPLIKMLIDAVRLCKGRYQFIISEGSPGNSPEPMRFDGGWYFKWCPYKDELFSMADLVVIRGGHSSITQAISFAKPMLVIPIIAHSEQLGNASKVERLGLGFMLRQEELNPSKLYEALDLIVNDDKYYKKAIKMKEVASLYDGAQNITDIAVAYIKR